MNQDMGTVIKGMVTLLIFVVGFFVLTLNFTGFQKLIIIIVLFVALMVVALGDEFK